MRNIAGIIPKWTDIRIADIIPNRCDICSTADIPELSEIASRLKRIQKFKNLNRGGRVNRTPLLICFLAIIFVAVAVSACTQLSHLIHFEINPSENETKVWKENTSKMDKGFCDQES